MRGDCADEHSLLGGLGKRAGDMLGMWRWYLRVLPTTPSVRPLRCLLRTQQATAPTRPTAAENP